MNIDWTIVSQIAVPIFTCFIGIVLTKYFNEREKLIAFYGHVASHALQSKTEGHPDNYIHSHAVVVRNIGNKTATNVKISHSYLPNFIIYPDTNYTRSSLPNGGEELIIPRITPKQEYTISYLYFPPITVDQIKTTIESDSGLAKIVNVRLQQVFPKWANVLIASSMLLGIITFVYMLFELGRYVFS